MEFVSLYSTRKASPLRTTNDLNQVAIVELIHKNLVANTHSVAGIVKTKFLEDTCRRHAATSFIKVATHRLIDVLQPNRLVFNKSELNSVIAVASRSGLFLHDDTGTSLDDRHRSDSSIRRKDLCHTDLFTDDSVNHHNNLSDE